MCFHYDRVLACVPPGVLTFVVGAAVFIFYVVTPRVAGKLFLLDSNFMNDEDAREEGEMSGPLVLDTVRGLLSGLLGDVGYIWTFECSTLFIVAAFNGLCPPNCCLLPATVGSGTPT